MRRLLFAAALTMVPMLAMADESISGQWQANQGHGVLIVMDILVDGHWFSQTVQGNKVVAELAGTYDQTKTNNTSGKLVFTPVTSKTTAEHGAAKIENDDIHAEQERHGSAPGHGGRNHGVPQATFCQEVTEANDADYDFRRRGAAGAGHRNARRMRSGACQGVLPGHWRATWRDMGCLGRLAAVLPAISGTSTKVRQQDSAIDAAPTDSRRPARQYRSG